MKEVETKAVEQKTEGKPEVKEVKAESKAFSTTDLIGQTKDAAFDAAKKAGHKCRVAEEDGVANMLSMDINPNRINFTITKGTVTGIKMG